MHLGTGGGRAQQLSGNQEAEGMETDSSPPAPPGHRWALTTAGMEAGGAGAAELLRWPLATQAGRDRGFQQAPHKNGRRARAYKHGFKQQVTPHN